MKSFIIQIIFFILTLNLSGQEYAEFPTDNAFWSAMHCESGPFVYKSGFVKVGVFGDTCGFVFDIDSAFYFISFREENKIIYFVPQQNGFDDPPGTEYPVFNFNLSNKGDTFLGYEYMFLPFGSVSDPTPTPGYGVMQDTVTITVESIDRVKMSDGTYRRRINFTPLTYGLKESWIEGIGSTKGFGLSLNVTNSKNTMICFSHNGINLETADILSEQLCTKYPDSSLTFADRCEYTTPNSVDEQLKMNIAVFPNPVNHFIKFTGLTQGDIVTIYNVLGQVVFETISLSAELTLDKFEYDTGIYFYTITTANNVIKSGKIIKN